LNLESAAQVAAAVAAHHVNVTTRDLEHLDLNEILASLFPSTQAEI